MRNLDALCEEFELQPNRGAKAVRDFLRSKADLDLGTAQGRALCCEIVMVDLELVLRDCENVQLLSPEYLDAFSGTIGSYADKIAAFEFRCRLEAEMHPRVVDFMRAFPAASSLAHEISQTCIDHDCYFMNVDPLIRRHVSTHGYGPNVLHLGFDPIEFGRRSRADNDPISESFSEAGRRVVIAHADDLRISRRHFLIDRKRNEIQISNISRKSQVVVEPTGRLPQKLDPQDELRVHLDEVTRGASCVVCSIYIGEQTKISIHANA